MRERFLKLFIDENETFCVSPNKYGYHSVGWDVLKEKSFKLVPPPSDDPTKENKTLDLPFSKMSMLALNPVSGFRRDENVTAFRSFLVEMDSGLLKDQYEYVKGSELPYSACVFSGGKSLHFAVCLDSSLGSLENYSFVAQWILNILKKADQQTKNPTRCIRMPDVQRPRGSMQKLLEIKERISFETLNAWLSQYPDCRPQIYVPNTDEVVYPDVDELPRWVIKALSMGVSEYSAKYGKGRNDTWFKIFSEMAKQGRSAEESMRSLEKDFSPERDFGVREWRTIAHSAVKGKHK